MAKIMLVEDDNNLREIYQARLSAEGYETVTAADGEEALALAVKEKPDLIIADIMMPKISGFDMLDILRSTPEVKDTKIIMMTALSQAEDRARAGRLGADRYLVKSQVTLEDVVKTAKEVLGEKDSSPSEPLLPPSSAKAPPPAATPPSTPPTTTNIPVATPPAEPNSTPPPAAESPASPPPEPPASPAPEPSNPSVPSSPPTDTPAAATATTPSITIDPSGALNSSNTPPPTSGPSDAASVEAQIKDFIQKTNEPVVQPVPPANQPTPAAAPSPPPASQVAPAPAPSPAPAPTPPLTAVKSEVPSHSTKIIQPINDISKPANLDILLAKESTETDTVAAPSADTVVAPDGSTTLASTEPVSDHIEVADDSDSAPPPPSMPLPPGHVFTPQTPAATNDDSDTTADPNSVAL